MSDKSTREAPATNGSVHAEILSFARKLLGSQALATLLLMGLAVFGYRALAADSRDGGLQAVAPVAAELERVKTGLGETVHDVAELKRRMERTETLTIETNANMRLLMLRFGVQPVTLEAKDGGP